MYFFSLILILFIENSYSVQPVYDINVKFNFELNCYNVTYQTATDNNVKLKKDVEYYNNIHMPCSMFIFYSKWNWCCIPFNDYCENFFIQRVKLYLNPERREKSEKIEHYSEKIILTTTASTTLIVKKFKVKKFKKQKEFQPKGFILGKFT